LTHRANAKFFGLTIIIVFMLVLSAAFLLAGELSKPLRTADQLLQSGHLDEARELAISIQRAFPKEIEPLLILGRIDFAARQFASSREWFRLASQINARHPLVVQYRDIFNELEHMTGELEPMPLPLPTADKSVTAQKFKRGWFGPNFTNLSPRIVKASEPVYMPPPAASQPEKPDFLRSKSVADSANEALKKRLYLKAYLHYTDLVKNHPEDPIFMIGKARATIEMGRYKEAAMILKPLVEDRHPSIPLSLMKEARDLLFEAQRRGNVK